MRYHDVEFVNLAYKKILHRIPDEEELNLNLKYVRTGVSRKEIIFKIVNSKEAREANVRVSGLFGYGAFLKLSKIPILGNILISIHLLMNINSLAKDLRALHNQLYRMARK